MTNRILFFAEGATLAHVARPYLLARLLDPERFDIVFARPEAFSWLTADAPFRLAPLSCQDSARFGKRLARGLPLYDLSTLRHYLADDLALIAREQPALIVGDFRLSLSVSARLCGIPYITLCDAYWSPELPFDPPLPVLPFTPYIPLGLAQSVFRQLAGMAFRLHAAPLERLRAEQGLSSLGHDLRRCYTDADLRLFANFPALFLALTPTPEADFIGPLAWSPGADEAQLAALELEAAPIYVNMGSSGDLQVLATLLPILESSGAPILLASAGRPLPAGLHLAHTRVYDYLPGEQICRHARLVVCNGGSPSTNQALTHGVPVLGIARNMDQLLNMRAIEQFGAGLTIRADRASKHTLQQALACLLSTPRLAQRAQQLAQTNSPCEPGKRFASHCERLLAKPPAR